MGSVHAKAIQSDDVDEEPSNPSSALAYLKQVEARVDRVHVEGLKRTKDDVVQNSVRPLMLAANFEEVFIRSHEVRTRLQELGCFRSVDVFIDTNDGPEATTKGLQVTFEVEELGPLVGGIQTLIGQNEGSLQLTSRMPNLMGRGESLQASCTYGSKKSSGFNATVTKPLHDIRDTRLSASVYQSGYDFSTSSFRQLNRGALLSVAFNPADDVNYTLEYESAWRRLSALDPTTPLAVRLHSGSTLLSAVRHTLTYDTRDSSIFPAEGALVKVHQEFAGLGGNVQFLRHQAELQYNVALPLDITVQAAVQGGHLKPGDPHQDSHLCDRYFLGGPLNVRGFQQRGAGPRAEGAAMGGNTYWAAALHAYSPLPFRPGRSGFGQLFRTHFFINLGNVDNFDLAGGERGPVAEQLWRNARLACGAGLCLRLGEMARVELNYCVPLLSQPDDKTVRGLQLGLGVSFL